MRTKGGFTESPFISFSIVYIYICIFVFITIFATSIEEHGYLNGVTPSELHCQCQIQRTGGQTDKLIPVYPPPTSLGGSIMIYVMMLTWPQCNVCVYLTNTSWPSDAIWCHRFGSTLVQEMASYLMATSHYLNQCWVIIGEIFWHSPGSNFTVSFQLLLHIRSLKIILFTITATSPRGQMGWNYTLTIDATSPRGQMSWNQNYSDVIMSTMASQITSLSIVYLTIYSGADQRIHQSSVSLAFVRGIHRWTGNSPHKGPVT